MEKITTKQQAEEWLRLNHHKLTGKEFLAAKDRAKLLPNEPTKFQTEEERQDDILETFNGKLPD